MIWIIKGDESYEIAAVNIAKKANHVELWVTRTNGNGLKILENNNLEEVQEYKEAIDFAIQEGKRTFRIN